MSSSVEEASLTAISELFDLDSLQSMALWKGLTRCFIRKVCVDVANVRLTLESWHVRRRHVSLHQIFPINGPKEGVALDLIDLKPFLRVSLQQTSEQVASVRTKSRQYCHILLGDLLEDLMSGLFTLHGRLLERVNSADHFVKKHAKRPPVDCKGVSVSFDDLWREILRRPAESVCHAVCWLLDL